MDFTEGKKITDFVYYPTGVNAVTGEYLRPPVTSSDLATVAMGGISDKGMLNNLKIWVGQFLRKSHLGPKQGINQRDLSQAGWGVIFHVDADRTLRDALADLLEWRKQQAGGYYHEYFGDVGYRTGETKQQFLARFYAGPGPADPEKVPYYLLIVGDPQTIPFEFEYALDVQYAVGRIYFDDIQDYTRYARSVVQAETENLALPKRVAFFGVQNTGDPATELSAKYLGDELSKKVSGVHPGWQIDAYLGEKATKLQLSQLVAEKDGPALLFSASHGVGLPAGHAKQLDWQGAIICSDWPGPKAKTPFQPSYFYSAGDLLPEQDVFGRVLFFFACYGAGSPQLDSFPDLATRQLGQIATQSFVARLPQRLLAHPGGGALALIGHIDRTLTSSYGWSGAGAQLAVFEGMFNSLLTGERVGYALEGFNSRYAELTVDLNDELTLIRRGKNPDRDRLAYLWSAVNDARCYVLIGDPAVKLAV